MRKILLPISLIATLFIFSCSSPPPQGNDKVKEYLKQLPKADDKRTALVASGLMYYARKDTLSYSGNVVFGNWILGNSTAACTATGNTGLLLSNIDHFDDLGQCADGNTIVRASIK
jgi:hypothetical protein